MEKCKECKKGNVTDSWMLGLCKKCFHNFRKEAYEFMNNKKESK